MMSKATEKIWIGGAWRQADASDTFEAFNPATGEPVGGAYPVSNWSDCDQALEAAAEAFENMQALGGDQLADFLDAYAERIESRTEALVEMASQETALAVEPRLRDVELPRTTKQLRQAASEARSQRWRRPVIDKDANIRSWHEPIGPVFVLGPNNFPLAFNGICGGDFAAALAAGNPVIAKAHPLHPGTTRLLVEAADEAARQTSMPAGIVQMLYHMKPETGLRVIGDRRLGAAAFTGSRRAGLQLKAAADAAGKPIYLEMSSINPVVILRQALSQSGDEIAEQFATSCLMACGQFCTNPGMVILEDGSSASGFIDKVTELFKQAPTGTMLGRSVAESLQENLGVLTRAGAELLTGQVESDPERCAHLPTLMRITGDQFLQEPQVFQTEAFGPTSLIVVANGVDQIRDIFKQLEGNLTGCIYHEGEPDRADYETIEPALRCKVGRLLNNKMPTGVAVSPAMNHGGPYPATAHPGFTAVGLPASIQRFTVLRCYDNVHPDFLPPALRDGASTTA